MQINVERETIRKAAWRILPIVFFGLIINFLDRVNLGFAALTMNKDLGLDQAVFGFAAGVFFLGYFVFEVPSNLILERVGARRWLARIMISWGLIAGATAFISNAYHLHIIRFLLGLAEAGYTPGVMFYLCLWFPKKYRAQMFSYFMVAQPVGAILGGPLAAPLLALDGFMDLKGWQWLFLVEAVPAIVLGFVMYFVLPSHSGEARWLSQEQRHWLDTTLAQERAEVEKFGVATVWQSFYNPRLLMLTVPYTGLAACFWCVVFFLPQIVKSAGTANATAILLTSVPFIIGGIGSLFAGRIADRTHRLEAWLFVWSLVTALGLGAMAYLGTSPLSLVGATMATTGLLSFLPMFWSSLPRFLVGSAAAGGFAFINSLGNLGGFAGPFVFGWVSGLTGGYAGSTAIFAGLAALSGLLFLVSAGVGARSAHDVVQPISVAAR